MADDERVIFYDVRQAERDPTILSFLSKRFGLHSEEEVTVLLNCLRNDASYRFENTLESRRYVIAFAEEAQFRRSVRCLCGCSDKVAKGELPLLGYVLRCRDEEQAPLYVPFYQMYTFSTASIALAVVFKCMRCYTVKYVLKVPRDHILDKSHVKFATHIADICQNVLGQELTTIEDIAWPNSEALYTHYHRDERTDYLDPAVITETSDERFVSTVCMPKMRALQPPSILFVQSPCGSGKSQFSVAAICHLFDRKLLPNGVFLPVATKAQAAAHTAAFQTAFPGFVFGESTHPRDLNILHYRRDDQTVGETCAVRVNSPDHDTITFGNLSSICTINSMVKHFQYYDKTSGAFRIHVPSLVWIDEIVSLLDALCLSEHMRTTEGGRSKAIAFFEHIITHADYIIATDAYLNTPCYDYIIELRQRSRRVDTIECIRFDSRHRINTVHLHHNDEQQFLHHVAENLNAGKKCIILSDSKQIILKVFNGISEVCPDKRLKVYSADTSDQVKDHDFAHCEDVWLEVDALFATPALTTGVNFTKQHFNNCFVFATGMSVSARTTLQMINRVRSYTDNEIFAYTPARYALNFPLDHVEEEQVATDLLSDRTLDTDLAPVDLQAHIHIDEDNTIVYNPIAKLAVKLLREHSDSRRDYTHAFVDVALYSGYRLLLGVPQLAGDPDVDPSPEELHAEQQVTDMLEAHATKQQDRFLRLSQLQMPDEWPQSNKNSTEEQNEISKMFAVRYYTGLQPADPVTPLYTEKLYDKTHTYTRLRYLTYLCQFSQDHPRISVDNAEADYYKRLQTSPTYFIWCLFRLVSMMGECGMLHYQRNHHLVVQPVTDIEHDPFPATIVVHRKERELPLDVREHLQRFYTLYCKQFSRDMSAQDTAKPKTTKTLHSLAVSAFAKIGIQVRQTKRSHNHTLYQLKAKPEIEFFLMYVLRPVITGREPRPLQAYNLALLLRLYNLFASTSELQFEDVHKVTADSLRDCVTSLAQ